MYALSLPWYIFSSDCASVGVTKTSLKRNHLSPGGGTDGGLWRGDRGQDGGETIVTSKLDPDLLRNSTVEVYSLFMSVVNCLLC